MAKSNEPSSQCRPMENRFLVRPCQWLVKELCVLLLLLVLSTPACSQSVSPQQGSPLRCTGLPEQLSQGLAQSAQNYTTSLGLLKSLLLQNRISDTTACADRLRFLDRDPLIPVIGDLHINESMNIFPSLRLPPNVVGIIRNNGQAGQTISSLARLLAGTTLSQLNVTAKDLQMFAFDPSIRPWLNSLLNCSLPGAIQGLSRLATVTNNLILGSVLQLRTVSDVLDETISYVNGRLNFSSAWTQYEGNGTFLALAYRHMCSNIFGKVEPFPLPYCKLLNQTQVIVLRVAIATNTPPQNVSSALLGQVLQTFAQTCQPSNHSAPGGNPVNYFCVNLSCPKGMLETNILSHVHEDIKGLSTNISDLAGRLLPEVFPNTTLAEYEDRLRQTILNCGQSCEAGGTFSEEREYISRIVIQVFSWLTLAFTSVALVSFVINRDNLNKYPTRIFVYINACYFLFSIAVLVQVTGSEWKKYTCNEDNTVRMDEPNTEEPTGYGDACAAMFFINYFLLISSLLWWFCLTHAWYKTFKAFEDHGLKDSFARYEIIYHICVWPVALLLGCGMLIQRSVDGVTLYGLCFTTKADPWFYYMTIPVIVVGVIGLPFLCLGTRMVSHFRRDMRKMTRRRDSIRSLDRVNRNEEGLRVFLGRMTLFIIASFGHLLLQIAIAIYRQINANRWVDEGKAYAVCQVTACDPDSCEVFKPDPDFGAFVLVFIFIDMQGIILCLWVFNRQTWQKWKSTSSRVGSRSSILLKRLSSHMLSTLDMSTPTSPTSPTTPDGMPSSTYSMSDSFQRRERKTSENTRYNEEMGRNFQMSPEEFDRQYDLSPLEDDEMLNRRKGSKESDSTVFTTINSALNSPQNGSAATGSSGEKRRNDFSGRGVRWSVEIDTPQRRRALSDLRLNSVSSEASGPPTPLPESPLTLTPSKSILKKRSMSHSSSSAPTTPQPRNGPPMINETFEENITAGASVSPLPGRRDDGSIFRLSRSPRGPRFAIDEDQSGRASPETRRSSIKRRTQSAGAELETRLAKANADMRRARFMAAKTTAITEENSVNEEDSPDSPRNGGPRHSTPLRPLSGNGRIPLINGEADLSHISWRAVEAEVELAEYEHRIQARVEAMSPQRNGRLKRNGRPVSVIIETNL